MKKLISIVLVLTSCMVVEVANAADTNQAPIADAGLARYAAQDPIVLNGTGSYDPDNSGTLSYTWRQISGLSTIINDANMATPTISGFVQTEDIQECEFELVVSDGELTSLSDTVKVTIVPDFGIATPFLENPPFEPEKPTLMFFGGGDCILGTYFGREYLIDGEWTENANLLSFSSYWPDDPNFTPGSVENPNTYYRFGDMIIVYLSSVAPDYKQPIQTLGLSTGGQPAIDVGIRLNNIYRDARYAVNRVTLLDASTYCRGYKGYSESIADFIDSAVDGEQCWLDNYVSAEADFYPNVLNIGFAQVSHILAHEWYSQSLADKEMNVFNHGVIAGAFWSVMGPGKNLQLAFTPDQETYKFKWCLDYPSNYMTVYDANNHPGRLPEPVTLVRPVDVGDPNGFVLTCEESENAVGYQLLFGPDPYCVMDYNIISDTPAPPNDVITTISLDRTWWTVRVRDQHGSTIYADPICMVAYNPKPADGTLYPDTWVNLSWNEGIRAASYDVYFGENFVDVQDGTTEVFRGNQTATYYIVGFFGFPYPDGLVPHTTYFWRIDDVASDGTVIHKGKIWRFTVSP
jgi:hypothetical protein